jgi:hypothetical protein
LTNLNIILILKHKNRLSTGGHRSGGFLSLRRTTLWLDFLEAEDPPQINKGSAGQRGYYVQYFYK